MASVYSNRFYLDQMAGSAASATVVLPIVFKALGMPRAIVDVGGGTGTWARVAQDLGVEQVKVLDGDYVPHDLLRVTPEDFIPTDLLRTIAMNAKFDLAVCLEVAEHLPPERADSFVAELTELSDHILFSAAIPGQGGDNHIHEAWLSEWVKKFSRHGMSVSDIVRPLVWDNPQVDWWYAQNTVLFSRVTVGDSHSTAPLDIVHPRAWIAWGNEDNCVDRGVADNSTLGGLEGRLQVQLRAIGRTLPPRIRRVIKRAIATK